MGLNPGAEPRRAGHREEMPCQHRPGEGGLESGTGASREGCSQAGWDCVVPTGFRNKDSVELLLCGRKEPCVSVNSSKN